MRLPYAAACFLTLAFLVASCGEEPADPPPPPMHAPEVTAPNPDSCGGSCSEVELCVQDAEGKYGCARICANQFHCWSGCCLALGSTGYNVCRPNDYCFAR
jgi:hypothetical protein